MIPRPRRQKSKVIAKPGHKSSEPQPSWTSRKTRTLLKVLATAAILALTGSTDFVQIQMIDELDQIGRWLFSNPPN